MIVDFSIKNFCSIRDRITLSFLPFEGIKGLSDLYCNEPLKGIRLLKFGIILGANASGKTTLLRALDNLRRLVCDPLPDKTRELPFYNPYLFGDGEDGLIDLSIRFIADGHQYHYELSYNSRSIVTEQLRILDNRWLKIYSRYTNALSQTVSITPGSKFIRYEDDFKQLERVTLWNNTVLGGSLKVSLDIPIIQSAVSWFGDYLYPIIEPRSNLYGFVSSQITRGKISKNRMLSYMRGADFMIEDVLFKEDSWDSLDEKSRMKLMEKNPEMSLDEIKEKVTARHVEFVHSNGKTRVNLDYGRESLGTQRFYQLCGVLDMLLHEKCMFFIDEIDSSIHPDLLEYLLVSFLVNSKESQLLITTHHREWLMRDDFLRPDTVWFTERRTDGSTQLFSLADFSKIDQFNRSFTYYDAYRRGVLGAKPSSRSFYFDFKDNEVSE